MTVSCRLRHCFDYTRKSAGEERKGPLPNNVRESAFQRTLPNNVPESAFQRTLPNNVRESAFQRTNRAILILSISTFFRPSSSSRNESCCTRS